MRHFSLTRCQHADWTALVFVDALTIRSRSDTIDALLGDAEGLRALGVHLKALRLAIARGNNEVFRTFTDRSVTLLETPPTMT